MYNIYCDNINTLGYERKQNAYIAHREVELAKIAQVENDREVELAKIAADREMEMARLESMERQAE